jgi:hypothetical protein
MKAKNHTTVIGCVLFSIIILGVAGCQAAPKEEVVAEGEVKCELIILGETKDMGVLRSEPELNEVFRGSLTWGDMNCQEPMLKGRIIALQDEGDKIWVGFNEFITDEGGVWKGMCDNDEASSKCTFNGEAKYKGMQIKTELSWGTNLMKYRMTKVAE